MRFIDIVSSLGLLQGLLLGGVILYARRPDRPTGLLSVFVFMISLRILPYLLNRQSFGPDYPEIVWLPIYFFLSLLAMLYLYARRLTGLLDWRRDWWHVLPGLVEGTVFTVLLVLELGGEQPLMEMDRSVQLVGGLGSLAVLHMLVYLYLLHRLVRRHHRHLLNYYSDVTKKQLNWVRITGLMVIGLAVVYPALRFGPLPIPFEAVVVFGAVTNTLIIYYVTINGVRQLSYGGAGVFDASEEEPVVEQRGTHSPLSTTAEPTERHHLMRLINERIREKEAYLDPNLTLSDVAEMVGASDRTVSRAINTGGNQNFNGYVNQLRIGRAQALLEDPKYDHYSMEGIAAEAGFSNKTTFYQAFRKHNESSPAAYRRERSDIGTK